MSPGPAERHSWVEIPRARRPSRRLRDRRPGSDRGPDAGKGQLQLLPARAEAGAIAAIQDEAHFQQTRSAIIGNRERLTAALIQLGFDVLPSSANFVFVRHPSHTGQALSAALRERAILVRHFSGPRVSDFIRITIGSQAELDRLTDALAEFLGDPSPT